MIPQELVTSSDTTDHLQRHELELDVLATVSSLLARQTGQRRMLLEVLDQLERRLAMVRCTVMLVSPDGAELVVEATRSAHQEDYREARYRLGEGIIGTVVQTGQPAIIPEIGREPRFQNRIYQRELSESRETGFLCVPIMLDSEVVGTLSADIPKRNSWPLNEHARVLGIVASLIAFDVKLRRLAELERHTQFISLTSRVDVLEKDMIVDALKLTRGNVAAAARLLKITPRIIRYKMKKLEIDSRHICEKR